MHAILLFPKLNIQRQCDMEILNSKLEWIICSSSLNLPISRICTIPSHNLHELLRNDFIYSLTRMQLIIPKVLVQIATSLGNTGVSSLHVTQVVLTSDVCRTLQILFWIVVNVRE